MSTFTQFCGIDVSKDQLDYHLLVGEDSGRFETQHLTNQCEAIKARFSDPKFDNTLFILEFTGAYSAKSVHVLTNLQRPISMVSPLQSHAYMAARGVTNKNDRQAAYCLALMGRQMKLRRYQAPSIEMRKRKQILSTLQALQKQQRMLKNQLHALDQQPIVAQASKAALQAVLQAVEAQLAPLQKRLYDPAEDQAFNEKRKYAASVKGVGQKTAEAVLLVTNGLDEFDNVEKVSKFLGITPHSHHSGSSVRTKGSITKYGSREVRKLLYMCALSAMRYNHPCKELYERLRSRGKPHKVAMVAVMHKLVKQIYACVTSRTLFDNDYQDKTRKKD